MDSSEHCRTYMDVASIEWLRATRRRFPLRTLHVCTIHRLNHIPRFGLLFRLQLLLVCTNSINLCMHFLWKAFFYINAAPIVSLDDNKWMFRRSIQGTLTKPFHIQQIVRITIQNLDLLLLYNYEYIHIDWWDTLFRYESSEVTLVSLIRYNMYWFFLFNKHILLGCIYFTTDWIVFFTVYVGITYAIRCQYPCN